MLPLRRAEAQRSPDVPNAKRRPPTRMTVPGSGEEAGKPQTSTHWPASVSWAIEDGTSEVKATADLTFECRSRRTRLEIIELSAVSGHAARDRKWTISENPGVPRRSVASAMLFLSVVPNECRAEDDPIVLECRRGRRCHDEAEHHGYHKEGTDLTQTTGHMFSSMSWAWDGRRCHDEVEAIPTKLAL